MLAKVLNDFLTPIRKNCCRSSSCVSACLCCASANRHSVLSCRRLPTRPTIALHSCAWQKPSQHSLLACAALPKRLVSSNARESCDSWLKTFCSAKIPSPFVTAFRCKQRVRELTRRTRGISLEQMTKQLATYLRGWKSYFGFSQTPSVLQKLEAWMRRRLRSVLWKQWKRSKVRFAKLRQRNIRPALAAQTAGSPHGPWRLANSPALQSALPIAYFDALGLPRLLDVL